MFEYLRLSKIGHCPRKLGYQVLWGETAPSEPYNPRFTDGWWHEYETKFRLATAGVEFEVGLPSELGVLFQIGGHIVAGHVDGLVRIGPSIFLGSEQQPRMHLPEGRFVLEIKSMSSGPFWRFLKKGVRESHPEYFDQVQSYMDSGRGITLPPRYQVGWVGDALHGVQEALAKNFVEIPPEVTHLPAQTLLVAKNKESGELRWEVVPKDDGYIVGLKRRWVIASQDVERGELPTRLHEDSDNYECRDCSFKLECWEGIENTPTINVEDPVLIEAAELYATGKELVSKGDDMMSQSRPILQSIDMDKFTVGNLAVTNTWRDATPWSKLATSYAPRDVIQEATKRVRVMFVRLVKGDADVG